MRGIAFDGSNLLVRRLFLKLRGERAKTYPPRRNIGYFLFVFVKTENRHLSSGDTLIIALTRKGPIDSIVPSVEEAE